jgi:hypothetical protein
MFIRSLSILVLDLSDYIISEFLGILNFLSTFDRFLRLNRFLTGIELLNYL